MTAVDEPQVHRLADVRSEAIGARTRIWQYVVVLPGAVIGADCNLCSHCLVEGGVIVGDRVTVKSGVQLWNGIRIEDDVFIGPNVTFTNDTFPRSRAWRERPEPTVIRKGASIGAAAVILPVTIGENAMIGAGAVVTRSVPAHAIVAGNPARIIGYADAEPAAIPGMQPGGAEPGLLTTGVQGVELVVQPQIPDLRGSIVVGEFTRSIPFEVKRYFVVFDVPSSETRGAHAHKTCHQYLICLRGSCTIVADDGAHRQQFTLDRPQLGLYLPPGIWAVQYRYTQDAMLLVFASDFYDPEDYIRDYSEFLAFKEAAR